MRYSAGPICPGTPLLVCQWKGFLLLLSNQSERAIVKVMDTWETWLALYAALVATGVLIIQIRQWIENRPRVFLKISPDMALSNNILGPDKIILVTATNRGSETTTVKNIFVIWYENRLGKLFQRKGEGGVIINTEIPNSKAGVLPYVLKPGSEWTGMIDQTQMIDQTHGLETIIANKCVYVAIYCSHRDKPIMKRLKRNKLNFQISNELANNIN